MVIRKSIWKNLGWALAATPVATFGGLVTIALIEALGQAITKLQLRGYWWIVLILGYIGSFIYFTYEPYHKRDNIVSALILYWEDQVTEQGKLSPPKEMMREWLIKRLKIWTWSDPELWSRYFPDEVYPKRLFGIVDGIISSLEK